MKNLSKMFAIGAACSTCLVVPAIFAYVGGTGLALAGFSLGSGWLTLDTFLCVAVPLALIAGIMMYQSYTKKNAAACNVDGSCGCEPEKSNLIKGS